ncbi:MAG TPA: acyltransferase family protein, partial [Pseudolysinimonas sp.]|nr:acyltransferase family protein [Pseudolysinimonas sp.]
PGWAAAVPVLGAGLVIAGGVSPVRGGVAGVLGLRPLQFGGRISYSLYLVHWPILVLPKLVVGSATVLPLWATAALAVVSVPVAWLLHRLVEDPARRARPLASARPRRSLLAAAAGALVLASVAAGGIAVTGMMPLDDGRALARTAPSAPPVASAIVATNLTPGLVAAADDNPAIYAQGCEVGYTPSVPHPCSYGAASGPAIVLFGDSHAAQWFPALQKIADANGQRLVTQTKSACASAEVALSWGGSEYASCDAWRRSVIASIRADPPAMVVIANYGNPDLDDPTDGAAQWRRGLESTIRQLSDVTQVVVIADTPDLRQNPAVCLSAHLDDTTACAPTSSFALDDLARSAEVAATSATGTPLIDLTGYFCTAALCPPIIGNTLVYRDSHHLTATFSAELAPALARALPPVVRGAG